MPMYQASSTSHAGHHAIADAIASHALAPHATKFAHCSFSIIFANCSFSVFIASISSCDARYDCRVVIASSTQPTTPTTLSIVCAIGPLSTFIPGIFIHVLI